MVFEGPFTIPNVITFFIPVWNRVFPGSHQAQNLHGLTRLILKDGFGMSDNVIQLAVFHFNLQSFHFRAEKLFQHFSANQGCSLEILKRTPKRYKDPVLWAWLEIFSPLRSTNSKTTNYLLPYFFRLNTIKRDHRSSPFEDLLRLDTLRGTFF